VSVVQKQAAYIARNIENAAAVGHVLEMSSQDRSGHPGKLEFYSRCSCGWTAKKPGSMNYAFVQVMIHVGDVSPLTDADILEAKTMGLQLPFAVHTFW